VVLAAISITGFVVSLNYSELQPQMPAGFLPEDVAVIGSPTQIFFRTQFEHYGSLPVDFFMKDLDYPHQQKEIIELFASLLDLPFISPYPTASWLQEFSRFVYLAGAGQLGLTNTDAYDSLCRTRTSRGVSEVGCTPGCPAGSIPNFSAPMILVQGSSGCTTVPNPFHCPMNTTYTHPVLLPFGMVDSRCFYGLLSLFQSPQLDFTNPTILPFFPKHATPGIIPNPLLEIGGQMGVSQIRKRDNTSRFYIQPDNPTHLADHDLGYACPGFNPSDQITTVGKGCSFYLQNPAWNGSVSNPIVLSQWTLYMNDVRGAIGNNKQVEMVLMVRNIIDSSPLKGKVFPQSQPFTYSEVHIDLREIWQRTFGIDVAVIAVISMVFLQSITAGIMTAAACAFIIIEVYAALSPLIYFNMITVACLLMGVGISVEFTAHLVASYTRETIGLKGPHAKIEHTLRIVGPPFLLGAFSTFFGNLPLSWSDTTFVQLYFFRAFSVLVAVGVANAFFFLPAKLMFTTLVADMLGLGDKGDASRAGGQSPQYTTSTAAGSVSTTTASTDTKDAI